MLQSKTVWASVAAIIGALGAWFTGDIELGEMLQGKPCRCPNRKNDSFRVALIFNVHERRVDFQFAGKTLASRPNQDNYYANPHDCQKSFHPTNS